MYTVCRVYGSTVGGYTVNTHSSMLVQSCPPLTVRSGVYPHQQSHHPPVSTYMGVTQDIIHVPIHHTSTHTHHNHQEVEEEEQLQEEELDIKVDASGVFGNTNKSINCFLRVDCDTVETESQLLSIESTVTETFHWDEETTNTDFPREVIQKNGSSDWSIGCSSEETHTTDIYSHTFERAFEDLQDPVTCPSSPSSSSSSVRSKGNFEDEDRRGEPTSPDQVQKKSCLDRAVRLRYGETSDDWEKGGRTVHFNDKNEVASQGQDGKFKVTYRQLGEKLSGETSVNTEGRSVRCQLGETSKLETVLAPITRNIDWDDCLPSERRQMERQEQEWDNPFQPEGEISQDADLMLSLWRGGMLSPCHGVTLPQSLVPPTQCTHPTEYTTHPTGDTHPCPEGGTHSDTCRTYTESEDPHNTLQHILKHTEHNGGDETGVGGDTTHIGDTDHCLGQIINGSSVTRRKQSDHSPTFQIAISDKMKHKNKLKKHCNMM